MKEGIKMEKRVLLCIMDGWGISTGSEKYDATKLANPVNVSRLEQEEKFIKIHADGERRANGQQRSRTLEFRRRQNCLSGFI